LSIDDLKLNYASTISDMDSLTKYAAALSAVVADQTCASLQTDARGLATAVGDIATKTKAPAAAAAAGPISQIVAAAGCAAINDVQLRILKASTDAANPSIQILVPLIAAKYNELYMTALTEAHTQLLSSMTDYLTMKNGDLATLNALQSDSDDLTLKLTQLWALAVEDDNQQIAAINKQLDAVTKNANAALKDLSKITSVLANILTATKLVDSIIAAIPKK
jgi:hypothetical protein